MENCMDYQREWVIWGMGYIRVDCNYSMGAMRFDTTSRPPRSALCCHMPFGRRAVNHMEGMPL